MPNSSDGKRLIVCCDGTGNEISERTDKSSNVLKFFDACARQPRARPVRLYFITRGVGTVLRPSQWRRFLQAATAFFGLATGYRLDDDVLIAYEFLMENYESGDDIFLFGFSRGA